MFAVAVAVSMLVLDGTLRWLFIRANRSQIFQRTSSSFRALLKRRESDIRAMMLRLACDRGVLGNVELGGADGPHGDELSTGQAEVGYGSPNVRPSRDAPGTSNGVPPLALRGVVVGSPSSRPTATDNDVRFTPLHTAAPGAVNATGRDTDPATLPPRVVDNHTALTNDGLFPSPTRGDDDVVATVTARLAVAATAAAVAVARGRTPVSEGATALPASTDSASPIIDTRGGVGVGGGYLPLRSPQTPSPASSDTPPPPLHHAAVAVPPVRPRRSHGTGSNGKVANSSSNGGGSVRSARSPSSPRPPSVAASTVGGGGSSGVVPATPRVDDAWQQLPPLSSFKSLRHYTAATRGPDAVPYAKIVGVVSPRRLFIAPRLGLDVDRARGLLLRWRQEGTGSASVAARTGIFSLGSVLSPRPDVLPSTASPVGLSHSDVRAPLPTSVAGTPDTAPVVSTSIDRPRLDDISSVERVAAVAVTVAAGVVGDGSAGKPAHEPWRAGVGCLVAVACATQLVVGLAAALAGAYVSLGDMHAGGALLYGGVGGSVSVVVMWVTLAYLVLPWTTACGSNWRRTTVVGMSPFAVAVSCLAGCGVGDAFVGPWFVRDTLDELPSNGAQWTLLGLVCGFVVFAAACLVTRAIRLRAPVHDQPKVS